MSFWNGSVLQIIYPYYDSYFTFSLSKHILKLRVSFAKYVCNSTWVSGQKSGKLANFIKIFFSNFFVFFDTFWGHSITTWTRFWSFFDPLTWNILVNKTYEVCGHLTTPLPPLLVYMIIEWPHLFFKRGELQAPRFFRESSGSLASGVFFLFKPTLPF